MEEPLTALVDKAIELGATDARLVETSAIVMDKRALLKCRYGCNRWGKYWTCQPHMGMDYEEFQEMLSKYFEALIIQSRDPKVGQEVTVQLEKTAMLEYGAMYAFGMCLCVMCEECSYPEPCRYPHLARPSMDGLGIDIAETVEPLGFKVEFDPEGALLPAWYTMVLLR